MVSLPDWMCMRREIALECCSHLGTGALSLPKVPSAARTGTLRMCVGGREKGERERQTD